MKGGNKEIIKFGAQVTFELNSSRNCFMFCEGIFQSDLSLRDFSLNIGRKDMDFYHSVFQITPVLEYKAQTDTK
jgi:hypothetical protein